MTRTLPHRSVCRSGFRFLDSTTPRGSGVDSLGSFPSVPSTSSTLKTGTRFSSSSPRTSVQGPCAPDISDSGGSGRVLGPFWRALSCTSLLYESSYAGYRSSPSSSSDALRSGTADSDFLWLSDLIVFRVSVRPSPTVGSCALHLDSSLSVDRVSWSSTCLRVPVCVPERAVTLSGYGLFDSYSSASDCLVGLLRPPTFATDTRRAWHSYVSDRDTDDPNTPHYTRVCSRDDRDHFETFPTNPFRP